MTTNRSIVVERDMPHAPEKVWRALTQSALIAEWLAVNNFLMKDDFEPRVGSQFHLHMMPNSPWDGKVDCEVLEVSPTTRLVYSWNASAANMPESRTTVAWTLAPTAGGTHLRMEQSGFGDLPEANIQGATWAWQNFVGALEQGISRIAD